MEFPRVSHAADAIQYRDGTTAFSYPPRLAQARTPRNLVGKNNPTYYIRFSFPAAAEEPLDKVIISLDEGRRDPVFSYQLDATQAFGINAFPVGQKPESTFVGYARLSFYRPGRGIWRSDLPEYCSDAPSG